MDSMLLSSANKQKSLESLELQLESAKAALTR